MEILFCRDLCSSVYKGLYPEEHDYKSEMKIVGKKVRTRREEVGLSLDDLADLLYTDKAAVSRIENGERVPKFDTILKLADALQTTPEMLCPDRFCTWQRTKDFSAMYEKMMRLLPEEQTVCVRYINALLDGLLIGQK